MYKIEKVRERFAVLKDSKIIAQGFLSIEDSLHCVWVLNGKVKTDFYNVDENLNVTCKQEVLND